MNNTNLNLAAATAPRYTSYPSSNCFDENYDWVDFIKSVWRFSEHPEALSLYFHIPFCRQLCYFCGCNKQITQKHQKLKRYMDVLKTEAQFYSQELHARQLGGRLPIRSVHFGGGSPNSYSAHELEDFINTLRSYFYIDDDAELSIEIDPRFCSTEDIYNYSKAGFSRLSIGIQDFSPLVQKAINRVQSYERVAELTQAARAGGFKGINLDLVYGLPFQNKRDFQQTIDQVIQLAPDRIALFGYAHMPSKFPAQKLIPEEKLPQGYNKLALLEQAVELFRAADYVYIGLDHFAIPSDKLAIAKQKGALKRNFQGYSSEQSDHVLGLGVSAVSQLNNVYAQNSKNVAEYIRLIESGRSATVKGHTLDADDIMRREVIMQLMCQQPLYFKDFDARFGIDFTSCFANELVALRPFNEAGYLVLDNMKLEVTSLGQPVVRAIAAVFDDYANGGNDYSKVA